MKSVCKGNATSEACKQLILKRCSRCKTWLTKAEIDLADVFPEYLSKNNSYKEKHSIFQANPWISLLALSIFTMTIMFAILVTCCFKNYKRNARRSEEGIAKERRRRQLSHPKCCMDLVAYSPNYLPQHVASNAERLMGAGNAVSSEGGTYFLDFVRKFTTTLFKSGKRTEESQRAQNLELSSVSEQEEHTTPTPSSDATDSDSEEATSPTSDFESSHNTSQTITEIFAAAKPSNTKNLDSLNQSKPNLLTSLRWPNFLQSKKRRRFEV